MANSSKYYIVEAAALPEVFLKVVETKQLLSSGECQTVGEATRRMGISRRDQVEAYRAQQKNTRAQNRAARPAVKKRAQTRYVSQEGPRDFSDREE